MDFMQLKNGKTYKISIEEHLLKFNNGYFQIEDRSIPVSVLDILGAIYEEAKPPYPFKFGDIIKDKKSGGRYYLATDGYYCLGIEDDDTWEVMELTLYPSGGVESVFPADLFDKIK